MFSPTLISCLLGIVGAIWLLFALFFKSSNPFVALIRHFTVADLLLSIVLILDEIFITNFDWRNSSHTARNCIIFLLSTKQFLINLGEFLALGISGASLYIVRFSGSKHNIPYNSIIILSYFFSLFSYVRFSYYMIFERNTLFFMDKVMNMVPVAVWVIVTVTFLMTWIELESLKNQRLQSSRAKQLTKAVSRQWDENHNRAFYMMERLIISYTILNILLWIPYNISAVKFLFRSYEVKSELPSVISDAVFGAKGAFHLIAVYFGFYFDNTKKRRSNSQDDDSADDQSVSKVINFIGTNTLMDQLQKLERVHEEETSGIKAEESTL
ncbi:hypothetical protein BC833DRAFT_609230 [Globomyces pollinis-pini]|nr:hypothetical protein BC833DRAFT_609230 [Globomyces pollinis-pini]